MLKFDFSIENYVQHVLNVPPNPLIEEPDPEGILPGFDLLPKMDYSIYLDIQVSMILLSFHLKR